MKVVLGLFLLSMLNHSSFSRMIIPKVKLQPEPIQKVKSQLEGINQNKSELNHERNLLEISKSDFASERELKTIINQKKKIKKNKKLNSRKLAGKIIESKMSKSEKNKSMKKFKKFLKPYGETIEKVKHKKLIKILKKTNSKNRKLWNWWYWRRRRQEEARRRAEAARRRARHQGYIRRVLKLKEKNFLLDLQRTKLKQLDRNKFDILMQKELKKDSELWSRTFIYDAILLTEKLIYIEHDKLFKDQMKLALKNESIEVSKLDKFYNKNFDKKMSELTEKEIEKDIFM